MSDEDYEIVWSDDGSHKNKKEKVYQDIVAKDIVLNIRLETKSRAGKAVTVIYNYPENPAYFEDLCKKLKRLCGVGGSLKKESIEIQGDQRAKIEKFCKGLGFQIKFTGG